MKISKNVRLIKGGTTECDTINIKSFDELKEIILNDQYSLSVFKTGIVTKEDFRLANCVGLDFDSGYTLKQAKVDFKKFKCIIATTKSHGKKKNGKIQDRFRVILFFTEPITDISVFYATYKKLESKFNKLDKACKNPNRWFYPSKSVVMVNRQGVMVKPVVDRGEGTKTAVEASNYLKIGKGKLSKKTKTYLRRGIPEGERNATTFKIAKDFQENGFSEDDAVKYITKAYTDNETLAFDFTEYEVASAVRSAYASDPTNGPRQPFKLLPIKEIYKTTTEMKWVIDKMLSKGGISLWSAPPKWGKSWIVRQMVRDMVVNKEFIGRKAMPGEIHYYAIEEQAEVIKRSFTKLGLPEDANVYVHVGDVFTDDGLKDLHEVLMSRKPVLAVVDTIFDLLDVQSENNYKEVKVEFRKLRKIARDTGTHIVCIHHANKGGNFQGSGPTGSNRTILGSTAVAGGVDAVVVLEMAGQDRVITLTGRMVKPITLRKLVWDKKTWRYSLGEKLERDDEY